MLARFLIIALLVVCALPARANTNVDYISVAGGSYDFDKGRGKKSLDYRLEYRWGLSLLPLLDKSFNSVEPYFQLHPTLGIEGNAHGAVFGGGGFNLDMPFLWHGLLTWGESVGGFAQSNDPRSLGSVLQFRSQLELGWQFDNHLRVTGYISHLSNAHIVNDNPGAEIIGLYLHVPLSGGSGKK